MDQIKAVKLPAVLDDDPSVDNCLISHNALLLRIPVAFATEKDDHIYQVDG